jgi:putative ABC transport system permease protein
MNTLLHDATFALRTMRRTPGFTVVAVVTLALGIGANVAMFGTAYNAFLKPLPFHNPGRLVMGQATFSGRVNPWAAGADYYDYRDQNDVFEGLAAILPFGRAYTITGSDEPERVLGTAVSVNLLPTLGVSPQLGRNFTATEGMADAQDVILISDRYWQRRYEGSPDALGRTVMINGNPVTVIGVMPAGYRFMQDVDFWRAMRPDRDAASERQYHNWLLVGRLADGITLDQAQIQFDVISSQLEASYPETNDGKALLLTGLHDVLVADYRTRLYVLTGAVGLILLIACANIVGMLLARAPARRVELSVRAALGASRGRLMGQLLAEAVLLAGLGGVLGTACAVWMQRVILGFVQLDLPGVEGGYLSWTMLGIALIMSLAAGVIAGVYPAVIGARGRLAEDLKAGSRTVVSTGTRFRSGLVVAQVALSIVLLIGAGLLIRSFSHARDTDPGFSPDNLLTASVELPRSMYPDRPTRIQFFTSLLSEIRSVPGVVSAGIINHLPIVSPRNTFPAYAANNPDEHSTVFLRSVLPGYFEAMQIPFHSGRDINDRDAEGVAPVAVINRSAADRFFPDGIAVGQRLTIQYFDEPIVTEVVGVVGDVRMRGLNEEPRPAVYMSYLQGPYLGMQLAIRTTAGQSAAVPALRRAVRNLDADLPVSGLVTMEEAIASSLSERKTVALSLTLYAVLPLLLAAVGLYAVLSYHVSERSHELGLRMALGAEAKEIGAMILTRGSLLIGVGVAIGVAGAVGLTRLLRQMLFGVEPTDPATFVGVCLFVVTIAIVACLVPAWRAVRVDPMVALQAD